MSQSISTILGAITAGQSNARSVAGVVSSVQGTNNSAYKVTFVPPTGFSTVAGDDTNGPTIKVTIRRNGSDGVDVCSHVLGTGESLVAETPYTLPLNTSIGNGLSTLKPGDVLVVSLNKRGSGTAVGAGILAAIEIL